MKETISGEQRVYRLPLPVFLFPLLVSLLLFSCVLDTAGTGGRKSVAYELQGTWKSNDPSVYDGTLEITYDRITIKGYSEKQTPPSGDVNERPFKDFTKGTALKAYSEEERIYIEDRGIPQEGIPYEYWDNSSGYKDEQFLYFTFGGRKETLKKTQE